MYMLTSSGAVSIILIYYSYVLHFISNEFVKVKLKKSLKMTYE